MVTITRLAGGKILERDSQTKVVTGTGDVAFAVRIKRLRVVEYVVGIGFTFSPDGDTTLYKPRILPIAGNVVGFTVNASAVQTNGTSITANVDVVGYA